MALMASQRKLTLPGRLSCNLRFRCLFLALFAVIFFGSFNLYISKLTLTRAAAAPQLAQNQDKVARLGQARQMEHDKVVGELAQQKERLLKQITRQRNRSATQLAKERKKVAVLEQQTEQMLGQITQQQNRLQNYSKHAHKKRTGTNQNIQRTIWRSQFGNGSSSSAASRSEILRADTDTHLDFNYNPASRLYALRSPEPDQGGDLAPYACNDIEAHNNCRSKMGLAGALCGAGGQGPGQGRQAAGPRAAEQVGQGRTEPREQGGAPRALQSHRDGGKRGKVSLLQAPALRRCG